MYQTTPYSELYSRLTVETAIVTFTKKDDSFRIMLATRNMGTWQMLDSCNSASLGGHDKRCNITNKNLAVMDLEIGEPRSFSTTRLINVEYLGEIDTPEKLEKAFVRFEQAREEFMAEIENHKDITMDMLD